MNEVFLVLVAGGTGTRIGGNIPKQYLEIAGKPIVCHAIQKFVNAIPDIRIIIVVQPVWKDELEGMVRQFLPEINCVYADGGETRFQSVKNGLAKISGDGIVMIHDAARPCVSVDTITRCLVQVEKHGSAIPVIPVAESMRKVEKDGHSVPVNRNDYKIVQTPQCFKIESIKKSFNVNYHQSFTDDAAVFENAGNKIHLVDGNPENIKITVPADLHHAEFLLK